MANDKRENYENNARVCMTEDQRVYVCVCTCPAVCGMHRRDRRYDTLFNFYILFCHAIGSRARTFFGEFPRETETESGLNVK